MVFSLINATLTSKSGVRVLTRGAIFLGGVGSILVVWTVLVSLNHQAQVRFPSPIEVARAISDLSAYNEVRDERPLLVALLYSVSRIIAWGGGAILLGGGLGTVLGLKSQVDAIVAPLLNAFSYPPTLGLLPLAGLVFQGDELTSLIFLTLGVALSLSCAVRDAIQSVSQACVEQARDWGASSLEIIRSVVFPLVLPKVLLAMTHRLSLLWGYITVVEYASTNRGLGELIYNARKTAQMEQAFAAVLVVISLSYVSYLSMIAICRYLSPWESKI